MTPATPVLKDVVLLGCGHAHVAVLRRFGMRPMPGVRLTVIAREAASPYSGMLPGYIAGRYSFDDMHIDARRLARFAGARLYHDAATGLDLASRQVFCRGRPPVPFDLLSIDIGSTPDFSAIPGAAEHATPVKPIGQLIERWEALAARAAAQAGRIAIGILGAGAGGVELAFAVRHRLAAERASVVLFGAEADVMPGFAAGARRRVRQGLAKHGIAFHPGHRAIAIEPGLVRFAGQEPARLDEILIATQASAPRWLAEAGLAVDAGGFVRVSDRLRSVSHPVVFAAGDIATMDGHPRAKSGVMAVRAGPPLAENLRRAVAGRALRRCVPQRTWLSLISTADGAAIGARGGFAFEGRWVFRLKDRIDRRFMRRFNELPAMTAEPPRLAPGVGDAAERAALSEMALRCGGCAAKVGGSILERVLTRLEPTRLELKGASGITLGLAARDDAAVFTVPPGKLLVQSVDQFRAFIDDPHVFGQVAAHHALGDLYAMGATPHSALALVTLPYGPAAKVEADLFLLLDGAGAVLRQAGAALIGGHSAEGGEMALGFAVNGLADPATLLRKSGLRPGDALVLTKPLGTGALFAADMRARARAGWIAAALARMTQPAAAASACLIGHGAHACTDVTGFGLAGHLLEMADASGVAVTLDLDAIPALDGALEVLAHGLGSSLQAENRLAEARIDAPDAIRAAPRFALLFDPQTAGGLLAGIGADRAGDCVAELRRLGYDAAAVIGRVTACGAPARIAVARG